MTIIYYDPALPIMVMHYDGALPMMVIILWPCTTYDGYVLWLPMCLIKWHCASDPSICFIYRKRDSNLHKLFCQGPERLSSPQILFIFWVYVPSWATNDCKNVSPGGLFHDQPFPPTSSFSAVLHKTNRGQTFESSKTDSTKLTMQLRPDLAKFWKTLAT